MLKWIRDNFIAFNLAVILHAAIIVLLLFGASDSHAPLKRDGGEKVEIVKAVSVDERQIKKEMQAIADADRRRKAQERARQRRLEREARKAREARKREQQRLAQLKRKREQERRRLATERRKAQKKAAEEKRRLTALKKKREQQERLRKENEKKLAALKKQRQAEERAEQERKAQKAREAAFKKSLEAERKAREAAKQKAADAALQKQLLSKRQKYMASIEYAVRKKWRRPASVRKGDTCVVDVVQDRLGKVLAVKVSQCKSSNVLAFQRSVSIGVEKASPLPLAPDSRVFDKNIRFTFEPVK